MLWYAKREHVVNLLGLEGSFQEDGPHFILHGLVFLGGVRHYATLQFETPEGSCSFGVFRMNQALCFGISKFLLEGRICQLA